MNQRRVTLTEAAQMLGVHRNTVRNWVLDGRFDTAAKETRGGLEQWTIDESEILTERLARPRKRSSDESLGDTAWVIHDLATRLADAEARAARAEAKLEELRRDDEPR